MYVVCGASVTDGGRKGVGRSGCLGGGVMGLGGPWACTSLSLFCLSLLYISLYPSIISSHFQISKGQSTRIRLHIIMVC